MLNIVHVVIGVILSVFAGVIVDFVVFVTVYALFGYDTEPNARTTFMFQGLIVLAYLSLVRPDAAKATFRWLLDSK